MRGLLIATLLAAALTDARAASGETFEGYWANGPRDCRNEDGPSSRTFIDLRDKKTGPLFDQYENHCRVRAIEGGKGVFTLRLRCHEFWEDFQKRANGRNTSVRIAVKGADAITIDGEAFRRCRR